MSIFADVIEIIVVSENKQLKIDTSLKLSRKYYQDKFCIFRHYGTEAKNDIHIDTKNDSLTEILNDEDPNIGIVCVVDRVDDLK